MSEHQHHEVNENKTPDNKYGWHDSKSLSLGRLFIGGFILILGLAYLARSAGWVDFNGSLDWSIAWPVILIFVGLSLIRPRGFLAQALGVILTLLILAVVFASLTSISSVNIGGWRISGITNKDGNPDVTQNIEVARSGMSKTKISFEAGAGEFRLYGGSSTSNLISGTLESTIGELKIDSRNEGDVQVVSLEQHARSIRLGKHMNKIVLGLANDIETDLDIDIGASDTTLDLTDVKVNNVSVDAGASSLNFILGNKNVLTNISLDAGASSVNFTIPKDVGVRFVLELGLSSKDLPGFNKIDDKTYQTANYDTASNKINVEANIGVSNLDVNLK